MSVFFGTDGLRGKVNQDLTYDTALKCGNSLAQIMKQGGKVLIGRDTRITGSYLVNAVSTGLQAGGIDVVDVGIIPTAGVSYLTKLLNFDYGIMITASHNPFEYNGIKILSSNGEKLPDKEEERIEKCFIFNKLTSAEKVGSYKLKEKLKKYYIDFLVGSVGEKLTGKKIVLDMSNGASYKIAPKVFKMLGATVISIGARNDGLNINKNCGSLHINNLIKMVLKEHADMGFAFDGDADRLIAVDEKGNVVDGDMIIASLAKVYKKSNELSLNAVVGTSHTNMGIEKALKECGIKLYRADVGDKYVIELMNKHGLSLGGEQSGHIIIKQLLNTGDGILSALQLASKVVESNDTMSNFTKIELYPQVNINIKVSDKIRILNSEILSNSVSLATQKLDGMGRVLVRASGTEPVIRVMVEGMDKELISIQAEILVDIIKKLDLLGDGLCVE